MSVLTTAAIDIYNRMHASHEGSSITEPDGSIWYEIYLNNACPPGMSRHVFAGHLSALKAAGVYRQTDPTGAFGTFKKMTP